MPIDFNDAPPQPDETKVKKEKLVVPEGITQLTAVFVDSFFLTYWEKYLKISFGETIDGKEYWRSAVVLPVDDAEILARRLAEAIKEIKEGREDVEPKA